MLITTSAEAQTDCQTRACNERVKAKQARHGHTSCQTRACNKRVKAKRARRAGSSCQTRSCNKRVEARKWRRLQRTLSPETKQMLVRLRNCETRGISYPSNYRSRGHHFGAYQYDWGSGSAGARAGFRVRPDLASPAEQDVRTARFYPAHRGEWACRG